MASDLRVAVLVPGLAASFLLLSGQTLAHQDLASYLAARSGADQTWRRHVAQQVYSSQRRAGFALPTPVLREDIARPHVLARLGVEAGPGRAGGGDGLVGPAIGRDLVYPQVNRAAKADILVERARLRPSLGAAREAPSLLAAPADLAQVSRFTQASRFVRGEAEEAVDTEHSPLALGGFQLASLAPGASLDDRPAAARLGLAGPALPPDAAPEAAEPEGRRFAATLPDERAGIAVAGEGPVARAGAGFGAPSMPLENEPFRIAGTHEPVPGFDPVLGPLAADRRGDRPDGALARALGAPAGFALAQPPAPPAAPTGPALHPAITLQLSGPALARAERCLAEAVYWEARGEDERGQQAVAQVVVNRAVSGFYPRDICGVVYQNAHRYLACQFTFACEGRRSLTPTEAQPWSLATRIARDMMAGRVWLRDVGHATHYHANYVRPWWARSMRVMDRIGVHIFYRPRQWGTGPEVRLQARAGQES